LATQLPRSSAQLHSQTGTLEYLSPEMLRGDPFVAHCLCFSQSSSLGVRATHLFADLLVYGRFRYNGKTDIFSLGVMMCDLCCGATPQQLQLIPMRTFFPLSAAALAGHLRRWNARRQRIRDMVLLLVSSVCRSPRFCRFGVIVPACSFSLPLCVSMCVCVICALFYVTLTA
jgi:serine/threonine protein kinase